MIGMPEKGGFDFNFAISVAHERENSFIIGRERERERDRSRLILWVTVNNFFSIFCMFSCFMISPMGIHEALLQ